MVLLIVLDIAFTRIGSVLANMAGHCTTVSNILKKRSYVLRHLSPRPTATATDPAPANSPTTHSQLVHQDRAPKPVKFQNPKKTQKLCNFRATIFDRKSPAFLVPVAIGGDKKISYIHYTDSRLNRPSGWCSENVKLCKIVFLLKIRFILEEDDLISHIIS